MITVIHHPTCSKCIGLLDYLQDNKIAYEHRDYMQDPLNVAELSAVLTRLQLQPLDIIRQNEPLFQRNFSGVTKTDAAWIQVLADHPALLQRPIILSGDQAIIGRPLQKALCFVDQFNK